MSHISSRRSRVDMSSDTVFLAAAEGIGRHIVADAIRQEGVCGWVGAVANPTPAWRAQYRALDPVVYDGTAGVGLFLAHLGAVVDDPAARATAVGAFRHAVSRARALPPARRGGLHVGALGVAWAAACGAALLDNDELGASARALTAETVPSVAGGRHHDVDRGTAGSIVGLLGLADAFDDRTLVDAAVVAGDALIDEATVTRHGWSWADPDRRGRAHLCGLSHGAGGIGWALLELFAVTEEERFRAAALAAFAYERSWLDVDSGTWPDLRIAGQRRGASRPTSPPTVGTWCAGEAGIALTRLRALEVLGAEAFAHDAALALETTQRELAAALAGDIEDLTLCHGMAGVADALLCGAAALGGRWHDMATLGAELGQLAVERYHDTGDDWPCGPAGGTSPCLFRGLSGIGWWLLRLHDGTIPSPLLLPMLTPAYIRA